MAEHYEIQIPTHNSIYGERSEIEAYEREMNVYFSVPEKGAGVNTGLLLLIAGFGGHAQANVYKKMRDQFADQYDLVVVQCDYFGWEYMQTPTYFHLDNGRIVDDNLLEEFRQSRKRNFSSNGIWDKIENLNNFNEMGLMQAVDNIIAVQSILYILQNKRIELNSERVFLYGHSHGSYLSYLCNRIASGLFNCLIDNSAWLFPRYIRKWRKVTIEVALPSWKNESILMDVYINYLAEKMKDDVDVFDLRKLYSNFNNKCKIISYHGIDDKLLNYKEKEEFCCSIANCQLKVISEKDVDGTMFKSTKHGLDADFLKLFDFIMREQRFSKIKSDGRNIEIADIVEFETDRYEYTLNYSSGLPSVKRNKK